MDFDLSPEQREIQATARQLLAARATPAAVRAAAQARIQDNALWRQVCQLGWPGIAIAEEHGGQGLGLVELCVVLEQAGAALAPIPLLPSVCAALAIQHAGSPAQRSRLLPVLADGSASGAIGLRQDGALIAGPAHAEPLVLLDFAGDGLLLEPGGTSAQPLQSIDPLREYATLAIGRDEEEEGSGPRGADTGDRAAPAGERSPRDTHQATEAAGERSPRDTHQATEAAGERSPRDTHQATAPAGEALPGDARHAALAAAVAVAAETVGVCDRALQLTVAYVKDRRQFDTPVGAFQAVSHRCAEMLLHTEQARSVVYHAAWAADAQPALLPAAASLAKALASEAVVSVTASAIQAHGGIGFTWEADVHWLYKRAQMDAALLGGARLHRRLLAAAIGLV
ncbi:MAG: acyl-CoA dehydrogenase family protein [Solirubrobacteraceae bacterium]